MPHHFPVAVHIFFVQGGRVLLLRRFKTGYEDGNYSVPAGHLEGEETVAASVWRGEPSSCEPDKCDELRWSARDDLPPNTIPYIRRALENYEKGVWFEEFGL